MIIDNELSLLIKSRYPVVYYESVDEKYALLQLRSIAAEQGLVFYEWSVTEGLSRIGQEGAYYQTNEPISVLKMTTYLCGLDSTPPGMFVLKDFDRYLGDALTMRLFKDAVNKVRNTKNTFVLLSAEYKLPKELEQETARILGGYPDGGELEKIFDETVEELMWTHDNSFIALKPEERKRIIASLKGLTLQQIRNVLTQCILDDNILTIKDLALIESYKRKFYDQEGLLEFCLTEQSENMAGFPNLKRWLSERKNSFSPENKSSLPPPKGVLLMGVQGCGKSLAIKIISRELQLPLYRLDLGRLYSKYIGETEQNLRKALSIVEKLCPMCLWIDEIEKGFSNSSGDMDGGVSKRLLGTFLTWMQERKASCFIAATANDVYSLPPEFLRKGRFDELFFVDLPESESRQEIFVIQLKKRGLDPEKFDLKGMAAQSQGFNGAEIEQAVISALYRASSLGSPIGSPHILEQLASTKPLSVLKKEQIDALREWARERTIPA